MKKGNVGVIVLIMTLFVTVLALCGVVLYYNLKDKSEQNNNENTEINNEQSNNSNINENVNENENENENNQNNEIGNNIQNENNGNLEEEKLPEWASYLLAQNIKSITVHRTFKGEGYDPSIGCLEPKQITKEELTQILKEMTKGKLTKHIDAGGFGGPCLTNIVVEFNGNEELELFLYRYIITENTKILSLLENEKYIEDNTYTSTEVDKPNTLFEYDWDRSFVETLFK